MVDEPISVNELFEKLNDENIRPQDLRPYFRLNESDSGPFNPVVVIDEEAVDLGDDEAALAIASFNRWSRRYRAKQFQKRMANGWNGPVALSEGDSWWQYPILLDDVIDNFMETTAVESLGAAGDLLGDMVDSGELIARYDPAVHHFVLVSGGGNDLLGEGRLATFVREYDPQLTPARYLNSHFKPFLDNAIANFDTLVKRLKARSPSVRIFTHTYAYAIPNRGRWLGRPLEKKHINDTSLQRAIIKVVVDRFHKAMHALAKRHAGNLTVVDCRRLLPKPADWNDELHPTNDGYRRVYEKLQAAVTASNV